MNSTLRRIEKLKGLMQEQDPAATRWEQIFNEYCRWFVEKFGCKTQEDVRRAIAAERERRAEHKEWVREREKARAESTCEK